MTENQDETCENCGQKKEYHPNWKCYTFKAKNHSPQHSVVRDTLRGEGSTPSTEGTPSVDVVSNNNLVAEGTHSPKVFIERAAKLNKKGMKAILGTDEEYDEYVKEGTFNLSEKIQEGNPNWVTEKNIKEFIKRYIGIINRQQGDLSKIKLIESLKKLAGKNLSGDL